MGVDQIADHDHSNAAKGGIDIAPDYALIGNLSITDGHGLLGLPNHHTAYESGLSNEEISRVTLDTDEVLEVWRLGVELKGGGSNSNVSINVYDVSDGSVLASTEAGQLKTGGETPLDTSSAGATITTRITTGSSSVNLCSTAFISVVTA